MIEKKKPTTYKSELVVGTLALAIGAPSCGSSDPSCSSWGPELWELEPRGCFCL